MRGQPRAPSPRKRARRSRCQQRKHHDVQPVQTEIERQGALQVVQVTTGVKRQGHRQAAVRALHGPGDDHGPERQLDEQQPERDQIELPGLRRDRVRQVPQAPDQAHAQRTPDWTKARREPRLQKPRQPNSSPIENTTSAATCSGVTGGCSQPAGGPISTA